MTAASTSGCAIEVCLWLNPTSIRADVHRDDSNAPYSLCYGVPVAIQLNAKEQFDSIQILNCHGNRRGAKKEKLDREATESWHLIETAAKVGLFLEAFPFETKSLTGRLSTKFLSDQIW